MGADRVPPFNLEAERSVLGACMLEREALMAVTEGLTADDFYDPRHRNAFEIISSMAERDIAVDKNNSLFVSDTPHISGCIRRKRISLSLYTDCL
mgnify:CR=1 FL=1